MNKMNKFTHSDIKNSSCIFFLCIVISIFSDLHAQQYPDTIWIPVTFYDFHSDFSNPEFEVEHAGSLQHNMVADTLDKDHKPVLGPDPFFNYYINKWFRKWEPGDYEIPDYQDRLGLEVEFKTVKYDTAFKNVVIKDSLPFVHVSNGTYIFERSGEKDIPEFFWLDGKGFDNEGRKHNYSFTMELHSQFTYQKELSFQFLGDDDVWAYINGRLAMDIGGIHMAEEGEIDLDEIAEKFGFEEGKKYNFDFFYAERHTSNSRIKITTNLFTPYAALRFYHDPGDPEKNDNETFENGDTIKAGESIKIFAHAFDSLGWRSDWSDLISIEVMDLGDKAKIISTDKGSITVLPQKPYENIVIKATFVNPDDPFATPITRTLELMIGPGDATVDSAFTCDKDGNGYIDAVELFTDYKVTISSDVHDKFIIKYNGIVFKSDSLKAIGGNGIKIFLEENITKEFQTDWILSLDVLDVKGMKTAENKICNDGIGPVVKKAVYYTGSLQSEQKNIPDSIKVFISELVDWPPDDDPNQMFRYYKGGKKVENAFSSMVVINDSSVMLIVSNGVVVEPIADSIQLSSSGDLKDKVSNRPHDFGRKAQIEYSEISLRYIPSSNPFIPGITQIDQRVRERFLNVINKQVMVSGGNGVTGTVIRLEVKGKTLKPLKGIPKIDSAYGTVKVYDVVGNTIRNDLYVTKISGNDYGIYWDGYNKRSRAVGLGTYLFSVSVTDIDNKKNTTQFKIGVTR